MNPTTQSMGIKRMTICKYPINSAARHTLCYVISLICIDTASYNISEYEQSICIDCMIRQLNLFKRQTGPFGYNLRT